MTRLRVLAVDDEQLALRRMELLLGKLADVELAGTANNGEAALAAIAALRPDVLLLDIKMAGMDGFDVVAAMAEGGAPQVIFVTAFDAFAARAFAVSATDYIVKPVELGRLRDALDKARKARELSGASLRIAELQAAVAALRAGGEASAEQEIWVEKRGEFVRLRLDDIDWVEAERDYVYLHARGNPYLVRHTVAGMHARLGDERFIRIRRSALVRRDRIAAIRKAGYGDVRVQLLSGEELRVGRTFVKQVRSMLGQRPCLSPP